MGVKFDQNPFGGIGQKVLHSGKIWWTLVVNNIDYE